MRVLLTGGGTAGHINPALAIAETIVQNAPGSEIAFVGIPNGKEADLVPREGYPLYFVHSVGFHRPLCSPRNLRAVWYALTSPYAGKTRKILDDFRPDIVIGTGGYACWPIMKAAANRGIPTAVHESNAMPGLAVKRLKDHVDRIWVNFERTAELIGRPEKTLRVGNPLRRAFGVLSPEVARKRLGIAPDRLLLLSFGGSLGAEAINKAALEVMEQYGALHPELLHIHVTGKGNYGTEEEKFRAAGLDACPNCILKDYLYDMPLYMAAADLVIARAGAMTTSELARMGKAAILIPSPNVVDNHQFVNAETLANAGAAYLLEEKELETAGCAAKAVQTLLENSAKLESMRREIRKFADRDANRLIWEEIRKLTRYQK